jgi:hypothetical protein
MVGIKVSHVVIFIEFLGSEENIDSVTQCVSGSIEAITGDLNLITDFSLLGV